MGKLVDGKWHDVWYPTKSTGGRFVRKDSAFRAQVTTTETGDYTAESDDYTAETGRYHLFVSYACPWAHRTLIVRALKGLQDVVSYSAVEADMLSHGWEFSAKRPDPLHSSDFLHQLYTRADPAYTGRVTVPVLWDKTRGTIVNNESSEILRMFNTSFAHLGDPERAWSGAADLYPQALRAEIDAVNADVYPHINNGVYMAGFATTQAAYEDAVTALFAAMDRMEARLQGRDWLVGDTLTEADIRLFTTLVRFDAVYHGHFKCNLRQLRDYPGLHAHTRRVLALPGVAETTHIDEIRRHYYYSHDSINPTRIVPAGPADVGLFK